MTARTPGPWVVNTSFEFIMPLSHVGRKHGAAVDDVYDRDYYAQVIASAYSDRHGRGDAKANLAFIVEACNSHDALVSRCERYRVALIAVEQALADEGGKWLFDLHKVVSVALQGD